MSIFETLKKYGKSKNNAIAEAIKDFNEFKTSGYIQSKLPSSGNIEVAIQALQAQAERRWIPVSERLPKTEQPVQVYMPKLYMSVQTGFYTKYYGEDDGEWYEHWVASGDVTHWMPLPEPPKEDNNE